MATRRPPRPTPSGFQELDPGALRAPFGDLPTVAPPVRCIVGQDRAREAITFGLGMAQPGYGIAVSGQRASGRTALVRELVHPLAQRAATPPDRVYVHNFADPRRPKIIALPPGAAAELSAGMQELTDACRKALPAAFESESYESRVKDSLEAVSHDREEAMDSLQRTARLLGFTVTPTPMGMMATPLGADGRPMTPQVLEGLPPDVRGPIEARGDQVQEAVMSTLLKLRKLEGKARENVLAIDREVTRFVVGPILDELEKAHGAHGLSDYFSAIEEDIVSNLETFKRFAALSTAAVPDEVIRHLTAEREALLGRYSVNAFVTHAPGSGAPVIEERQPSYFRLLGRVEFENQLGVMVTDFRHIRPGSLHRASGGFLILQAEDLLADPRTWARLKLALRTREAAMDDLAEMLPIPVASLSPEPMPLDVKVILIGQPFVLAVLDALDPDFHELFKVRAEFEPDLHADDRSITDYVGFLAEVSERRSLLPLDQEAIRETLRYGSRLSGRQDRLTARLGLVEDIYAEANTLATTEGAASVGAPHILRAMAAAERRSGLIADRIREMIAERRLYVATEGSVEGQVNGLAILAAGDRAFGMPMRITCRAGAGRRGIVDIERETERSGAIHTKGVLVLEGFLMGTFGRTTPLSFNASLTFEQSYEEVEGDSASAAELCAILTALAQVAVRQDLAITGSVDQFGNIQAVGGITQKVEGFFDVCKEAGLTGTQGVIIPTTNRVDLCLKPEVVDAVREGRFHVWSASHIKEILHQATGIPAGEPGADGAYPENTLFRSVADRLELLHSAAVEPRADAQSRQGG